MKHAIIDLDKAIRPAPKFVDAYYARAKAKFQLTAIMKRAIVDLDSAIKIDPDRC